MKSIKAGTTPALKAALSKPVLNPMQSTPPSRHAGGCICTVYSLLYLASDGSAVEALIAAAGRDPVRACQLCQDPQAMGVPIPLNGQRWNVWAHE